MENKQELAELQKMQAEAKKVLKNYSKNELVRIVIGQLVDLFILKQKLEDLTKAQNGEKVADKIEDGGKVAEKTQEQANV